jgi:hypothetical protein
MTAVPDRRAIDDQRSPLPARGRWRLISLAIAAAVVCTLLGAYLAVLPDWIEQHRQKTGWLPPAKEVTEMKVFVRGGFVPNEWSSAMVPLDAAPEIVELLSRRVMVRDASTKKEPKTIRLLQFDTSDFLIEVKATTSRRPIQILVKRNGWLRIGDHPFVLRMDDFLVLEKQMLDCLYADQQEAAERP